jgi:hypothetical protein
MNDELPPVLATWLDGVRPGHRKLLAGLHRVVTGVEPALSLSLRWRVPAYSLGDKLHFYLADQSDYVHLGFFRGAHLENLDRLIEGTGKNMRHIKVAKLDRETAGKLRQAIEAALAVGRG